MRLGEDIEMEPLEIIGYAPKEPLFRSLDVVLTALAAGFFISGHERFAMVSAGTLIADVLGRQFSTKYRNLVVPPAVPPYEGYRRWVRR